MLFWYVAGLPPLCGLSICNSATFVGAVTAVLIFHPLRYPSTTADHHETHPSLHRNHHPHRSDDSRCHVHAGPHHCLCDVHTIASAACRGHCRRTASWRCPPSRHCLARHASCRPHLRRK